MSSELYIQMKQFVCVLRLFEVSSGILYYCMPCLMSHCYGLCNMHDHE